MTSLSKSRARLSLQTLERREVPATWAYSNSDPNSPGQWTNGSNWVGGQVPAANADITIPAGTGSISISATPEINSLTINADWGMKFFVEFGSLNIPSGSIGSGTFELDGGGITFGSGSTTVDGVEFVNNGMMMSYSVETTADGVVYVGANGIDTNADILIDEDGESVLSAPGAEIRLKAGANVINQGWLDFDANNTAIKKVGSANGIVNNSGSIFVTSTCTGKIEPGAFSSGNIEVRGHLNLTGSYTDEIAGTYGLVVWSGKVRFGDQSGIDVTNGWYQYGGQVYTYGSNATVQFSINANTTFNGTTIDLQNGGNRGWVNQIGSDSLTNCTMKMAIDYQANNNSKWTASSIALGSGNTLTLSERNAGNRNQGQAFELLNTNSGISGSFDSTNLGTLNLNADQTSTKFSAKVP